jgi:hypothetical protein
MTAAEKKLVAAALYSYAAKFYTEMQEDLCQPWGADVEKVTAQIEQIRKLADKFLVESTDR